MAQTPAEYINPIIQAMLAQHKLQQQRGEEGNRIALEREKMKQDQAYKDQLIKESQGRLEESTRQHQANEDIKNENNKRALEMAQSQLYTGLSTAIKGAKPGNNPETGRPFAEEAANAFARFHQGRLNPASPQGASPDASAGAPGQVRTSPTLDFPNQNLSEIPLSGFSAPEDEIQKAGDKAGAVAGAVAGAKAPFDMEKLTRQHELKLQEDSQKEKAAMEALKEKGASAERIANIHGQTVRSAATINQNGHLRTTELLQGIGIDDPNVQATIAENGRHFVQGILDGKTDYKALNKAQKIQADFYAKANNIEIPTDGKTYAAHLDALNETQALYNQARDLASKYSIDAPQGGRVAIARGPGGALSALSTSSLNSDLAAFKGHAGTLAVNNDQNHRGAEAEIARSALSVFDPKATTAQNMKKIEDQEQLAAPKVRNLLTGIPKEEQDRILGTRGIALGFGKDGQQTPTAAPINAQQLPSPASPPAASGPKPPRPDAVLNKILSKPGHNVWDVPAPTQSPTAVQVQPGGIQ